MSKLFLLSEPQMARISPHFPRSHGKPRVDDRRVISGIIYVIRNGLRWKDAPQEYGPHKTLYNRFVRWSRRGVFERIFAGLAGEGPSPERIDPPQGASDRCQSAEKGALPRCIGRTKGGLNSKLHAVCDDRGKPIILLLSEGQMSDHTGARLLIEKLPPGSTLIGDRGYDSDHFRAALHVREIKPCIPPTKNRRQPIEYDKALYKQRHKIENLFARLKDWRRIAMRYDRCAHTFFSAICLAATVVFYL